MRLAVVASNYVPLGPKTKKGTEIFTYQLIQALVQRGDTHLSLTAFCSGDSDLPIAIEAIEARATSTDSELPYGKHVIFELALLSQAFATQDRFDAYHVNIGNGDIVLPFLPFVKKPVIITLHHSLEAPYLARYFAHFTQHSNLFIVPCSDAQRSLLPWLPYTETIYHGIDTKQLFPFAPEGGDSLMWAGRAVPNKGIVDAIEVARHLKKSLTMCALTTKEHDEWHRTVLAPQLAEPEVHPYVQWHENVDRDHLASHYSASKVFLFPTKFEEPFGFVAAEAMACGTPVVAYARGAIPEIVRDGETGFLVNPSADDIRGDWIIKQTGVAGLREAAQRIYDLSPQDYRAMRQACRDRVLAHFTVERMATQYAALYRRVNQVA